VQAEREHVRKVRKKELARQQGEGTWMLPSVDERVTQAEEVSVVFQEFCVSCNHKMQLFLLLFVCAIYGWQF